MPLLLLLEYLNFCSLFFELLFLLFLGAYLCMYVSSFGSICAIYFWFWGYQQCCCVILSHYNRCIQMVHSFIYRCIYFFRCWGGGKTVISPALQVPRQRGINWPSPSPPPVRKPLFPCHSLYSPSPSLRCLRRLQLCDAPDLTVH